MEEKRRKNRGRERKNRGRDDRMGRWRETTEGGREKGTDRMAGTVTEGGRR